MRRPSGDQGPHLQDGRRPFDAGRPGRFLRCLPGLAFRRAASTLWGEAMVGVLRADRRAGPEERTSARVIELNPEGADGIFLGGVNRCFPERWSDSVYRWYLRRELAGRAPD